MHKFITTHFGAATGETTVEFQKCNVASSVEVHENSVFMNLEGKMKKARFFVLMTLLVCACSFAVYTPHIGGSAGSTVYVKGPYSGGPDNSPMHESWDLITPGSPNYLGYYYRFIFYNGTLHIDPTGKVGFTEKIFGSGNDSTTYPGQQYGTINVEGYLTGAEIRPWKNGNDYEVNVWGNGMIELTSMFRVGVNDGGVNEGYCTIMDNGLIKTANLSIYGAGSFVDLQGGEMLILNSNWSVGDVLAESRIYSSTATLSVTTKDIDGILYTSITPEPATLLLLCAGGFALRRRGR